MKHTPEPWIINSLPDAGNGIEIKSEAKDFILLCRCGCSSHYGRDGNYAIEKEEANANANRIVACVNACQGIDSEALPELLSICKALAADAKHRTNPSR